MYEKFGMAVKVKKGVVCKAWCVEMVWTHDENEGERIFEETE